MISIPTYTYEWEDEKFHRMCKALISKVMCFTVGFMNGAQIHLKVLVLMWTEMVENGVKLVSPNQLAGSQPICTAGESARTFDSGGVCDRKGFGQSRSDFDCLRGGRATPPTMCAGWRASTNSERM